MDLAIQKYLLTTRIVGRPSNCSSEKDLAALHALLARSLSELSCYRVKKKLTVVEDIVRAWKNKGQEGFGRRERNWRGWKFEKGGKREN